MAPFEQDKTVMPPLTDPVVFDLVTSIEKERPDDIGDAADGDEVDQLAFVTNRAEPEKKLHSSTQLMRLIKLIFRN